MASPLRCLPFLIILCVIQIRCLQQSEIPESHPHTTLALNSANFDSLAINTDKPAVIEFYSAADSTCAALIETVDSVALLKRDVVTVGTVDVDQEKSLAGKYAVRKVPAFLLIKKGTVRRTVSYAEIAPAPAESLIAYAELLLRPDTLPAGLAELDSIDFYDMVNVKGRVSLVEFYSPKCSICASIEDTVKMVAQEYSDRALVGRVDILTNGTLAVKHLVLEIPAFYFFRDGENMKRIKGRVEKDSLTFVLDSLLGE